MASQRAEIISRPGDAVIGSQLSPEGRLDNPIGLEERLMATSGDDGGVDSDAEGENFALRRCSLGAPPLMVKSNARLRPFTDGGGLCSPGRWLPGTRAQPALPAVRDALLRVIVDNKLEEKVRTAALKGWAESPFDNADVTVAVEAIAAVVDLNGGEGRSLSDAVPAGQPLRTHLLSSLLEMAGDPDASFIDAVGSGVSLGLKGPLPRATRIFRRKQKWRLPFHDGALHKCSGNYRSADDYEQVIWAKVLEELPLGRVIVSNTLEEAAEVCNCKPEEIVLGKLGVVDGDRIIFDASASLVNNKIRLRDQVEHPGAQELRLMMSWAKTSGIPAQSYAGTVGMAKSWSDETVADTAS